MQREQPPHHLPRNCLGDIGEMFPDRDPVNLGRDSVEMLRVYNDLPGHQLAPGVVARVTPIGTDRPTRTGSCSPRSGRSQTTSSGSK